MIDGSRPEQKLLAAVVAQAVRDACLPAEIIRSPSAKKGAPRTVFVSMRPDAASAMRFLFDDSVAGLSEYAQWLDFDPVHFRKKLLNSIEKENVSHFSEMQCRAFRVNYKAYMNGGFSAEQLDQLDAADE